MMRPLLQTKVWKFLMSQIGNHAFMQKFVELLNSASPKLAVELIAPDAVFNSVITGREHTGPSGYLEILAALKAGFPDVRWELQELVGEGNVVAARFNISGTHLGEFQGIKPGGKEVRISAMNLYRLKSCQNFQLGRLINLTVANCLLIPMEKFFTEQRGHSGTCGKHPQVNSRSNLMVISNTVKSAPVHSSHHREGIILS